MKILIDWLFPRAAAAVHHGGAGMTAAALRAGVPGIVTAFGGDQFAWADVVTRAGVSPRAAGGGSNRTSDRSARSRANLITTD